MKAYFYTFVFTLLTAITISAQTVWTGNTDTDWQNPTNWSSGVPATGMTATVPGTPQGGNFPIFSGGPILDYTIQNAGIITFNTLVYNNGTIINFGGATIINDGQFFNAGSGLFDNDGILTNNSEFTNYGSFDSALSGEVTVSSGATFAHAGLFFKTAGPFINNGTTVNTSNMRCTNLFDNYGSLTNYNSFEAPFGSTFNNQTGAVVTNTAGSIVVLNGSFTNDSPVNSQGEFMLENALVGINNSTITSDDYFEVAGSLINNGTITSNSALSINDGGTLTNNSVLDNNGLITLSICGSLVQNGGNTIIAPVENDGLIYLLNGNVEWTNVEFGNEFTNINETKPPVAGCLSGIFVSLDANGEATIIAAQVDKGSYGSCGASLVSVSMDKTDFTIADLGPNIVTLTVEDNLGKISTCESIVNILEYIPPVIPNDDPEIDFACPDDITVASLPGAVSAEASWTAPTATSTCTGSGGSGCGGSTDLPGYLFLGELNDSRYYMSNSSATWAVAKQNAINQGGHLATIGSTEEDNLIINNATEATLWIGFTDEVLEGTFLWDNGDAVTYTNWNTGEPNDLDIDPNVIGADYAAIIRVDGNWRDRNGSNNYPYVIEIPCCSASSNIPGFTHLGEYQDHNYYISDAASRWDDAQLDCAANGGHLIVVNDLAENNFIQNAIDPASGSIWTGLNTVSSPGVFNWINGDPTSFFNWRSGEPNGNGIDNAARLLKSSGEWTDRELSYLYEYVMEIPCSSAPTSSGPPTVTQIRGPQSGDNFALGITEVAYEVNDDCGNQEICTFEVTVDAIPSAISFSNCPSDVIIDSAPGATSALVDWGLVSATTDCFAGGLEIEQALGPNIGDVMRVKDGPQLIVFNAIDSCGNFAVCAFNVQVIATPSAITMSGCPANINVMPDAGSNSATVSWIAPTGTTSCFTNVVNVSQLEGPASGSDFASGTTTRIIYLVADECGNTEICIFFVSVGNCPAIGTPCDDGDLSTFDDQEDGNCNCAGTQSTLDITCQQDISTIAAPGASGTVIDFSAPTTFGNCPGSLTIDQTEGLLSGEIFPIGSTTVSFSVSDDCGNIQNCSIDVVVLEGQSTISLECPADITVNALPGETTATVSWVEPAPGSDCTVGQISLLQTDGLVSGSLFPEGTSIISYEASDSCGATISCSFSITVLTTCLDADSDGICAAEDCDDNDANLPALAGSSCDDGNPDTQNDMILADGCTCEGTPSGDPDCADILITPGIGMITITGLNSPITLIQIFDASWNRVFKCAGDCDPGTQIISGLAAETHFVKVNLLTSSWDEICAVEDYYDVLAGDPCDNLDGDVDGDGICAAADCDDNDPNLPAIPGTSCDDGDSTTTNDIILTDGCGCAGNPPGDPCANLGGDADEDGICAAEDCDDNDPNLPTSAGNTCDDGNANTSDDVIQADGCTCAGTPVGPDCGTIEILPGDGFITVLNLDGAPISSVQIFDASWSQVFKCAGDCNASEVVAGLSPGQYFVKVSFYDASWQLICAVEDFYTVTNGNGDPCDALGGDADGDGICAVNDCDDSDATLPAIVGNSCDDGDSTTVNDVYLADGCTCEGTIPGSGPDCNNITITTGDGSIIVGGLDGAPITSIQIFDPNWSQVFKCAGDCDGVEEVIDSLASATYFVKVAYYDASWNFECSVEDFYVVQSTVNNTAPSQRRILDFQVRKGPRQVDLHWGSNTGNLNDYFVIEKSVDAKNFETIFVIENKYTSAGFYSYNETDTNPFNGINYYRLKQVHLDGTYVYSGIRKIVFKDSFDQFTVFPNPASDQVYVHLKSFSGLQVDVEFYDALGRKVIARSLRAAPEVPLPFDISDLSEGAYLISVKYDGRKRVTQRLVIIKE